MRRERRSWQRFIWIRCLWKYRMNSSDGQVDVNLKTIIHSKAISISKTLFLKTRALKIRMLPRYSETVSNNKILAQAAHNPWRDPRCMKRIDSSSLKLSWDRTISIKETAAVEFHKGLFSLRVILTCITKSKMTRTHTITLTKLDPRVVPS